MFHKYFLTLLLMLGGSLSVAQISDEKNDSGWVSLFNGEDLSGLVIDIETSQSNNPDPTGAISVHDGMIHFYQDHGPGSQSPYGVVKTDREYSNYRARVTFQHGEIRLRGDPNNSGLFYHVKDGPAVWPPSIECQLKRHWNSIQNRPCSVEAGDCNEIWAADFWILGGAQITNRYGDKTALGGCCNPALVNRNEFPDYEKEGWNLMEIEVYHDSIFYNIFNGNTINWGSQSTYDNGGQRVPLTEGAIALELEGGEIMFKDFEIIDFDRTLTITSPISSQELAPGDSLEITWETEGAVGRVFLEYKIGEGDWTLIQKNIDGQTSYKWEIPDVNTDDSLDIRVGHGDKYGESPVMHKISGSSSVKNPINLKKEFGWEEIRSMAEKSPLNITVRNLKGKLVWKGLLNAENIAEVSNKWNAYAPSALHFQLDGL